MFSRAKYASVHLAAQGIHHAAKRFGGLQTFRVLPPPYKDGMVTAWADFSTPNDARIASNSLHGRGVPALGKAVLSAQYQATISYTVPGTVYDKLASDIFFLKGTCWRQRLRSSVHVTDPRRVEATAGVRIKLAADNLSSLAPLKIAFEKILHGERVTDNGKAAWHPFLATDDGALFIEELERLHPGVWIEARRSTRTIILFGHIRLRRHVRSALLAKIGRLHAQQIRYIRLSSRDVEYFVRGGLAKLQEIFGPENVFLRLLDRSLGVRGSDATYEPVAKAVRETQLQHSEARPSSTIECPVCFDEPVCPITMRCGHVWCGLCMSNYLISANENRQFPLTCLGGGATCKEPLPLRVAQDILSASDFDAVVNAAFTSFINSRPEEFYHCPTPDCPQIYREVTDVILQCPSCLVRICSECHVEAHDGLDCEDRDRNDKLFQAWLESNDVKSCPGCKAPIEKSDGCNHMTCTRCKTHICWKCMATFPKGDGIYDHMRNEHGGIWD
ncbi:hypothetical protein PLICRDRAFT_105200 [Plicaturopsis crispa FD-325 SS-3]|nr:hypothetical protein PLICRDRAFT_105200 [Plicaturopsis crispa FD-325 SS-3]